MPAAVATRNGRTAAVVAARWLIVCGVVMLLAGPWLLAPPSLKLLTEVFCMMVLATMWNLLAGYADIVTVGQHALVGVGSYALFGFTMVLHWSPLPSILLAAIVAGVLAVPMLAVIFRLRAAYLAVGTWVMAEITLLIAGKLPGFGLGAGSSFSTAVIRTLGTTPTLRYQTLYVISLALVLASLSGTWALLRSRYGLGLKAMRDTEDGAASVGVDLRRLRVGCFLFTAPFVGLAGALIALQKGRISPQGSFSITEFTVYVIFIVIIGGIGSIEGPIAGTILFFLLRQALADLGTLYLIVLGTVSILVILFEPRGLWGLMKSRFLKEDIFPVTRGDDHG